MHDESYHCLLYLFFVFIFGQVNFVLYIPLIMHALLESGDTLKLLLDTRLSRYHPLIATFSEKVLRDTLLLSKSKIHDMKIEIEVYMGVYLIAVWFMRRSHIFGIVMYLQMIRVRYMLGGATKQACARIDRKIQDHIVH